MVRQNFIANIQHLMKTKLTKTLSVRLSKTRSTHYENKSKKYMIMSSMQDHAADTIPCYIACTCIVTPLSENFPNCLHGYLYTLCK